VKTNDLVDLAARNLRESLLRNSLTTLGIGVGVASLVAMLSLGIGLQQLADRRLARSGLFDTIVVTSRRSLRGFNRADNRDGTAPAESRPLDESARVEMARLPNVLEAVPDIRFVAEVRYEGKPYLTMLSGVPLSARDKDAFDNMQGRFFSSDAADEAILQIQFADELLGIRPKLGESGWKLNGQTQTLIGKELTLRYAERVAASSGDFTSPHSGGVTPPLHPGGDVKSPLHSGGDVKLPLAEVGASTGARRSALQEARQPSVMAAFSVVARERKLRIVAVTDQDPEGMRGVAGARMFIPLQMAENLHVLLPSGLRGSEPDFSSAPAYPSLSVRVKSENRVESVQDAIRKLGFNTFSILDATRSLRRFFAVLDLFLGIFGSLALAVAALGIVNTLVMAILERRREIGIMKAIGASDGDVKRLFLAEAAVMGLLGGMLGVALGWVIGRLINAGANLYLRRQNLPPENLWAVPWWLVGGAIAFAILVSMISGLYPAARAARLDPVQALRYE
jgi:putative ABC transport system permease protein